MKNQAYLYSLRLLSGREYSSVKLKKKLIEKKFEKDEIDEALKILEENKYLSNERYISAKVKQLALRGKSKRYIRQSLGQEGLDPEENQISEILEEAHIDENEQLTMLIKKKCQNLKRTPENYQKNYLKVLRFALSRGHSYEAIKKILSAELKGNIEFE